MPKTFSGRWYEKLLSELVGSKLDKATRLYIKALSERAATAYDIGIQHGKMGIEKENMIELMETEFPGESDSLLGSAVYFIQSAYDAGYRKASDSI